MWIYDPHRPYQLFQAIWGCGSGMYRWLWSCWANMPSCHRPRVLDLVVVLLVLLLFLFLLLLLLSLLFLLLSFFLQFLFFLLSPVFCCSFRCFVRFGNTHVISKKNTLLRVIPTMTYHGEDHIDTWQVGNNSFQLMRIQRIHVLLLCILRCAATAEAAAEAAAAGCCCWWSWGCRGCCCCGSCSGCFFRFWSCFFSGCSCFSFVMQAATCAWKVLGGS